MYMPDCVLCSTVPLCSVSVADGNGEHMSDVLSDAVSSSSASSSGSCAQKGKRGAVSGDDTQHQVTRSSSG